MAQFNKSHGLTNDPVYLAYHSMKHRCYNKNQKSYKNYGGRGIVMSDRWRESFLNFFEDMGFRPSPKHTLDRIDNNKGYSKENCRWATRKEQNTNQRTNYIVEIFGEKMCFKDACLKYGKLKYATSKYRFVHGYSLFAALGYEKN